MPRPCRRSRYLGSRELTNDFSPPANSKRVFIVYGRIIHRDGNVSRHKLLLVHFDHFGRNLLACLFCQQCLERHRRVLDWRFALQRPKGAPLSAQEGTFKADTIIYGGEAASFDARNQAVAVTVCSTSPPGASKATKLPAHTEARSCNRYDQGSSLPCYAADARLRRSWTNNFFYRDRASSRACTAKTLCGHAGFFRVSRRLRSNGISAAALLRAMRTIMRWPILTMMEPRLCRAGRAAAQRPRAASARSKRRRHQMPGHRMPSG